MNTARLLINFRSEHIDHYFDPNEATQPMTKPTSAGTTQANPMSANGSQAKKSQFPLNAFKPSPMLTIAVKMIVI